MAEKRKDKRGRVLRTGESQRHDLTYQYRYKNLQKKWQYVYVPMTDDVYRSLQWILEHRHRVQTEMIVDGYTGFLMLDKNGRPKVALHIENEMRWAMKKYAKLHPDNPLPHITPHVFRHTFCTNMANSGMDVKMLQYLMGHSDVGVTLNVYTHSTYERAAEQLAKVVQFRKSGQQEQQSKVG